MAIAKKQYVFMSRGVLDVEDWELAKILSAANRELTKHKDLSAFVTPSLTRKGDFIITMFEYKPRPEVLTLVGLPSETRPPIVQTLFEES